MISFTWKYFDNIDILVNDVKNFDLIYIANVITNL
jgi:hypothetical protein